MRYYLGVDIGTTHTKAVVATDSGKIISEIKKTYPSGLSPQNEQDPDELFQTVVSVLKESIDGIADKENISCISFSAAMHSLVAIDKEGNPLTPLFTWADTRSHQQARELKQSGLGNRIYQHTGVPIHAMSPLCKIAWLRETHAEIFSKAVKFLSGKEYVFYKLFGEFIIDHSIAAATGLFNFKELAWNKESLSFAGIGEEKLSKPVPITFALTRLNESLRDKLSLPADIPFIIGASDGSLATLGAGAIRPGEAALTIGTSGALRSLIRKSFIDPKQRLFNYAFDKDFFLSGGATNNGGNLLKWFIDTFTDGANSINDLLLEAASVPAGSEGLICLPYINGERAPVWDASAKGVFVGISFAHTRAHFLRAMMEGICFSLLQILNALEESGEKIHTIYANGGFIESPLWLQMLADILDKKLKVSYAADASALGAVLLGMYSQAKVTNWDELTAFTHTDQTIDPDPTCQKIYRQNFSVYQNLYTQYRRKEQA